jgi:small subunit ribosomal protein S2
VYTFQFIAEKRKWSSRQAHNLKVVGSNPTSALSQLYQFLKKLEKMKYQKKLPKWNISISQHLKNGTPIGHTSLNLSKKKYWHPLMSEYLLGIRNKTAIFNNTIIKKSLLRAFYVFALILKENGNILVINTNSEYFHLYKNLSMLTLQNGSTYRNSQNYIMQKYQYLNTSNISYCCWKWVGGTLTNWKQVSKSVLTFAKFSERCEIFLTKNNIEFPRYKKIKTTFQGFLTKKQGKTLLAFYEKPDAIFLINPNENRNIIAEANKLHIPIIAFVESNTNIKGITYPIPINIYSISFIYYCIKKLIILAVHFNKTNKN